MKVPRSAIAGFADFAALAAAHAVEMKNWRAQMARVQKDEQAGITGAARHWPYPKPGAHPLVEAAVNENDEMDFEIEEDGPGPAEILRAKKDDLIRRTCQLEQAAIALVAPPGKRRLWNLREGEVVSAHAEMVRRSNAGALKSAASAMGLRKEPELLPADAALLRDQAERRRRIAAIEAIAAQTMHDIEDLTAGTIGDFQIPDFTT